VQRSPNIPRSTVRWLLYLASLPFIFFLAVPLVSLILRTSSSALLSHIVQPQVTQALMLSVTTTAIATAIALVTGTPVAYLLARKKFWGRSLLDALIELPIVLPPAVAGIALLVAFGRRGLIGEPLFNRFHIDIAFTTIAVVMAQLFVASPFFVKSAAAGFAGVDTDLEKAAAVDGASPLTIFRTITLPLSAPALIGGAIMTWARALGEFGATIIFAGNFPGRTQTMPLAIYIGFEIDLNISIILGVILLAVSFIVLATVRWMTVRRFALFWM
jgi:molybdate transport system permease protein